MERPLVKAPIPKKIPVGARPNGPAYDQAACARSTKAAADGTVSGRLPETYQWLLVPVQASPQKAIEWQALRLSGQDPLAIRASKKLRSDELLTTGFAASRLRMELDRVPLWRGDHVALKQLVEDFARYPYLPRLKDSSVLLSAIREGAALLTWEHDAFAFADSLDEGAGRYRGLRGGHHVSIVDADSPGVLVRPEVARKQMDAETVKLTGGDPLPGSGVGDGVSVPPGPAAGPTGGPAAPATPQRPKRFHGSVTLDATRVGRDASRVADEVVAHLAGLVGARVQVTLEIEADVDAGVPENVVRVVMENGRALKFTSQGFEEA